MPQQRCPSAAQFEDYFRGALPPAHSSDVESHLAECPLCLESLRRRDAQRSLDWAGPRRAPAAAPAAESDSVAELIARLKRAGETSGPAGDKSRRAPALEDTATGAFDSSRADKRRGPSRETQRLAAGVRLGKYEVLEHLGGGGFGDVYRCRDMQLQREVALKLPRPGLLADARGHERFLREARAAAQLTHPRIVSVYEAGEIDGQCYIASKYVAGHTLRREMPSGVAWAPERAATLIAQLAAALHDAHLHGIFHRDVKPENVLLDVDGEPHLADFGLARRLEGETLRTAEGLHLGTPAYMSPEQAAGESHLADARSDQWALGVMLYELLAGRRPFVGGLHELLAAIRGDDPPPPSSTAKGLPRDLELICLKCLEKDADRRYPSCQHLADDLERWLRGDAISLRPPAWWESALRLAHRNRLATAAIASLFIAAILGGAYWATRPAYLDLRIKPADATVTLDGQRLELVEGHGVSSHAPGRFVLSAAAPGHVPAEREVVLSRGSENTAAIYLELTPAFGYFEVLSTPPGAEIEVRGPAGKVVAEGVTPFRSPRLPTGRYTAALSKALFHPKQVQVEAPDGDRLAPSTSVTLVTSLAGATTYAQLLELMAALNRPQRQPWAFENEPLRRACDQLGKLEGIEIRLNEESLKTVGVTPATPLKTFIGSGILHDSLRRVLQPLKLGFYPTLVDNGPRSDDEPNPPGRWSLVIEVYAEAEVKQVALRGVFVVVYPVHDIQAIKRGDFDSLIDQITRHIRPEYWDDVGGPGSIRAVHQPPALIISQTWDRHFSILRFLEDLKVKQAQPAPVPAKPHPWPANQPAAAIAPFTAERAAQFRKDWTAHLGLPATFTNREGMTFCLIPPGEFTMGTPEGAPASGSGSGPFGGGFGGGSFGTPLGGGGFGPPPPANVPPFMQLVASERPAHRVILTQPFYLGMREITQGEYETLIGKNPSAFAKGGRSARAVSGQKTDRFPVDSVSWLDAVEFCNLLTQRYRWQPWYERTAEGVERLPGTGYRLPTEAEWEFACRAGTTTSYSTGDADADASLPEAAWTINNSGRKPHTVGSRKPNAFGLRDMHGNMAEWVQDYWSPDYYAQFATAPAIDPAGPPRSGFGILRGGSCLEIEGDCRSSKRGAQAQEPPAAAATLRLLLPIEAARAALGRPKS